jgi:putative addiction module component (TIGR02574 family)
MGLTIDQITAEALRLPADSRAHLADQLVESLADASSGELAQIWAAEAIRRRQELQSGSVQAITGEQVADDVRRAAGRK